MARRIDGLLLAGSSTPALHHIAAIESGRPGAMPGSARCQPPQISVCSELRHTFGRHAMAGGVQANIVQAVLGHASLATTTRYTSADSDEAWDAVQKVTKKRL